MHILFVHKNFPAQFGHIAKYLVQREGFQCTFISERKPGMFDGIRRIQYRVRGGATAKTHYCSRTFENFTWHSHAVYETMKAHPEVQPDLIVGHSGFGSTACLADLYRCPIINYFEYYYHARGQDMDFRPEFPSSELDILRCRTRNAMLLLDLQTCAAGYSPTDWQRSRFPEEYQHKLTTVFDGIDTDLWRPLPREEDAPRRVAGREIPPEVKIVTYVSRGFEAMRGFDVFMRVAKRICDARRDVVFVCVGSDRTVYGGDQKHIEEKTFREHVLAQDSCNLDRFIFTGSAPREELVRIFSLSDLHIYLTVPFVLSWSMMNALACGCTVLGSGTPPVCEMIEHGQNGLLADFHDEDQFVRQALEVLDDPSAYRPLGTAGTEMIRDRYSLNKVLPKMLDLYRRTIDRAGDGGSSPPQPRPSRVAFDQPSKAAGNGQPGTSPENRPQRTRPLKLLFAIPHYWKAEANGRHGSSRSKMQSRVAALQRGIVALHRLFGKSQGIVDMQKRCVVDVDASTGAEVDIVVCTVGNDHCLSELKLPPTLYEQRPCTCEPSLLGFECHAALQERLGGYDYYCFLEDDLVLHDQWFFAKLDWFAGHSGNGSLLQPNRFEIARAPLKPKLYVDGDMVEKATKRFQDVGQDPEIVGTFLDAPVTFRRTLNPHAGSFFLSAEQMQHWASQPYFLDRDTSFIGPLESAATLGIMRTFRIYKPAPPFAAFLEIQHSGSAYISVARKLPVERPG